MMDNTSSRRLLSVTVAICTVVLCTSADGASDRSDARDGWKTYRNDRYMFRVSYPADGRVQTSRHRNYELVRILNHDDAGERQEGLAQGEYFVEVFIYDHRLGHRMDGKCHDVLREASPVKLGRIEAWRGTTVQADDTGSTPQAVCVESTKVDVVVTASEADPLGPLANRILDSIRFGN